MTGEVVVQAAEEKDTEALADLVTELGYPSSKEDMDLRLRKILPDTSYITLIAERDGKPLGMSGVHLEHSHEENESRARIMSFVIGSENRGQGVGRALISAAEAWAREMQAADITLTTHKSRTGAHEFYRKMGYQNTGYRFDKTL